MLKYFVSTFLAVLFLGTVVCNAGDNKSTKSLIPDLAYYSIGFAGEVAKLLGIGSPSGEVRIDEYTTQKYWNDCIATPGFNGHTQLLMNVYNNGYLESIALRFVSTSKWKETGQMWGLPSHYKFVQDINNGKVYKSTGLQANFLLSISPIIYDKESKLCHKVYVWQMSKE